MTQDNGMDAESQAMIDPRSMDHIHYEHQCRYNRLAEKLQTVTKERDAAQAKLSAIGKLKPTDYDDREQLLGALFKILRGTSEGGE